MKWTWIRKREGELILSGTPFHITYENGKFIAWRDGKKDDESHTLDFAKWCCEQRARDLAEIGLVQNEETDT